MQPCTKQHDNLGGGNSNIFSIFTPKIGEDEPILPYIFLVGLVQPPTWQLIHNSIETTESEGSNPSTPVVPCSCVAVGPVAA